MRRKILLIVDPQNDFCDPSGALYVKGAEECMKKLGEWIESNSPDEMFVTFDNHYPIHIATSAAWVDKDGKQPEPYTVVKPEEKVWTSFLLQGIPEEQWPDTITIWPNHCILGTWGANIYPELQKSIESWSVARKRIWVPIYKGMNCLCEEYGAFSTPQMQYMTKEDFKGSDLFVAGVAGDYCVKECLTQLRGMMIPDCTITELDDCIAWIG